VPDPLMKTCSKCKAAKPLDEFNKNQRRKDGFHFYCKPCHRERTRKWRIENPEYNSEYYEVNRKTLREKRRKHHEVNPQHNGVKIAIRRSPLSEHALFEGASREEVRAETAFDYRLCRLISQQTGIPHEIDHIHMIKDGGVHRLHNLRIITRYENRRRGDHSADGFDLEDDLTDEEIERLDQEVLDAAYA